MTEQQLLRMAKRRLAILRHAEEITGNVALTCRYYGISRQCFYTWRRRYDAHGLDGLRDRVEVIQTDIQSRWCLWRLVRSAGRGHALRDRRPSAAVA